MVDLGVVVLDIVVRAGQADAQLLSQRYASERGYPGVYGISVVFHPGYDLDQLTLAAQFPHGSVSYAPVQDLRVALQSVGYDLVLYITPSQNIPDHHTLGVTKGAVAQQTLDLVAANALVSALQVVQNPHRGH